MDFSEKTVKENLVFDGRIIQVYNDDVMLDNGKLTRREYVNHRGGASILAIDKEDNIYLVEQYRYAYKQMLLEIPAGKLEKGEDPRDCAERELKEEIGGSAKEIRKITILYPTPGYTNEPLYIYEAVGLEIGDNKLDDGEFLNVKKIPFKTAFEMVKTGEIKDGKTVVAILYHALNG